MASNSSQVIADLITARDSTFTAGEVAAASAAAGPIMDIKGNIGLCVLRAQEISSTLAYLLEGTMVQTNRTAPSGGIIPSSDSTLYGLLVGVYQIMK
jgi:hypothetical protein